MQPEPPAVHGQRDASRLLPGCSRPAAGAIPTTCTPALARASAGGTRGVDLTATHPEPACTGAKRPCGRPTLRHCRVATPTAVRGSRSDTAAARSGRLAHASVVSRHFATVIRTSGTTTAAARPWRAPTPGTLHGDKGGTSGHQRPQEELPNHTCEPADARPPTTASHARRSPVKTACTMTCGEREDGGPAP